MLDLPGNAGRAHFHFVIPFSSRDQGKTFIVLYMKIIVLAAMKVEVENEAGEKVLRLECLSL